MEMRMEYELCAVADGPADSFGIAPAFMANDDTKCQWASLKNTSTRTGRIDGFLGAIELDFVLESRDGSVSIDDERRGSQPTIDDALRAEDNG